MPKPNVTDLDSGSSDTDGTSVATNSVSPTANSLVLASVAVQKDATPQNTPTLSGAGMTWVQVRDFFYDDAGSVKRLTMFRALDASPGSGVLTFDFAGQTQASFLWTVVEFDNVDTGGADGADAIVQDAQDPASPGGDTVIDVTLAAFADIDNVTYGVGVKEINADADMVGDSNMTDINEEADGENDQRLIDQWVQAEENTVSWSWGTSRRRGGFAVEIQAGAGNGGVNVFVPPIRRRRGFR